jgi:hypothetical protein
MRLSDFEVTERRKRAIKYYYGPMYGWYGNSDTGSSDAGVDETVSAVYKSNIPEKYRQYPILGKGATSIVLDAGPDKIIMITRDDIKTEWLMQSWGLGIAKYIEKINYSRNPRSSQMSAIPIHVLEMPKLFPLSPANKKIIKTALVEIDKIYNELYYKEKSELRRKIKILNLYLERHQNGLFRKLALFLKNYEPDQFSLDLHMKNFLQDSDGKIVIVDPIISEDLLKIIQLYRNKRFVYDENFGSGVL